MKTFTVGLQGELAKSTARLARCMWVQRRDGGEYGFTTNRKALVIGGVTYEPASSFTPSDISGANNLETDDLQVDGLLDSAAITEDDLRAGRWDYAEFRIFQVNWADLTQGDKKDRRGHLGEVRVNRSTFIAELLGMMDAYGTSIGEITTPKCRANLGDARCKVDLGPLTVTGTIDLCDTDFFTLTDSARTEADAYFDEGVITFTDGDAIGLSYEVKGYLVGLWVTKTPVAYDVTGASYSMTPGCMKRLAEDCRDRFDNVNNFRGEPWLRGNDALVQIGRGQ